MKIIETILVIAMVTPIASKLKMCKLTLKGKTRINGIDSDETTL